MVPYMIDQTKSPSTEVKNNQQLSNNLSNDTVSIIGFFEDDASPLFDEYIASAYTLRKFFKFSHVFDKNIADHINENFNSIVIFKPAIFQSPYEEPRYRLTDVS